MATWNKERVATQRLLGNNFDDPKWKTTALKNAYALLSKRRFGMFIHRSHRYTHIHTQLREIQIC